MLRFYPSRREEREDEFKPKRFLKALKTDLETEEWEPLGVEEKFPPKVFFIDGVRRTELRVSVFDGNFLGEGIFVSVGAGALEVDLSGSKPTYRTLGEVVRRFFVYYGNFEVKNPVEVDLFGKREVFVPVKSPMENVSAFANILMRGLEVEVAKGVLKEKGFTLMDGTVKTKRFVPTLAYIVKEVGNFHLKGLEGILFELKRGERTPAFLFSERVEYYNPRSKTHGEREILKVGVFVKLSEEPFGNVNPLEGLARLELPFDGAASPSDYAETLNAAAAIALHFANHPLRDRRSPQNLTAIAFLERELRRLLGKYELVRRGLIGTLGVAH